MRTHKYILYYVYMISEDIFEDIGGLQSFFLPFNSCAREVFIWVNQADDCIANVQAHMEVVHELYEIVDEMKPVVHDVVRTKNKFICSKMC